jgi:hypothetical protein
MTVKVVLGLDISTSVTGVCVLSEETGELLLLDHVKLSSVKTQDEFEKASFFEKELERLYRPEWEISNIFIEKAAMMCSVGMSSAQTIMTLGRFNGIISYMLYKKFNIKPVMVAATSARSKLAIKINRLDKTKNTKEKVFDIVRDRHPEFPWLTHVAKTGKKKGEMVYDKENFDMCDAYILTSAGRLLFPRK